MMPRATRGLCLLLLSTLPLPAAEETRPVRALFPDPRFEAPRDPFTLVVRDFDGDGRADVMTANAGQAAVLLGDGAGGLRPPMTFDTRCCQSGIAVADFDGDGVDDLAAANSDSILVMRGRGDGTFEPADPDRDYYWRYYPTAILTTDFDRDGIADFAVSEQPGAVSIYRGLGDGSFTFPAHRFPAGDGPSRILAGDLDGDRIPDLVLVNTFPAYDLSVFLGVGDGTFGPEARLDPGPPVFEAALGDLDRDRNLDLVLGTATSLLIVPGLGDGTFGAPAELPLADGGRARGITVVDLDRDRDPDLLVPTGNSTGQGRVSVFLGDGAGGFGPEAHLRAGQEPVAVAVGEFDGDGVPDLVVTNHGDMSYGGPFTDGDIALLPGRGDGAFGSKVPRLDLDGPDRAPSRIAAGDLDGDGVEDLVALTRLRLNVLLGGGNGTFPRRDAIAVYGGLRGPEDLALIDLNDDDVPDLVLSSGAMLGNGDGTFGPFRAFPPADAIGAGDFDGDGLGDVALVVPDENAVWIRPGRGDATFEEGDRIPTGWRPRAIAVGDLDHDGDPDLAVAHTYGTTVMMGRAGASFESTEIDLQVTAIALADVDEDGNPDLLGTHFNGFLRVQLGLGDGSFGPQMSGPRLPGVGDGGFRHVLVEDLDGDGHADLAAADPSVSNVIVLTGRGDGTFQRDALYDVDGAIDLAAADLDGDGRRDLAALGSTDAPPVQPRVDVLLNQGRPPRRVALDDTDRLDPDLGPDPFPVVDAIDITGAEQRLEYCEFSCAGDAALCCGADPEAGRELAVVFAMDVIGLPGETNPVDAVYAVAIDFGEDGLGDVVEEPGLTIVNPARGTADVVLQVRFVDGEPMPFTGGLPDVDRLSSVDVAAGRIAFVVPVAALHARAGREQAAASGLDRYPRRVARVLAWYRAEVAVEADASVDDAVAVESPALGLRDRFPNTDDNGNPTTVLETVKALLGDPATP